MSKQDRKKKNLIKGNNIDAWVDLIGSTRVSILGDEYLLRIDEFKTSMRKCNGRVEMSINLVRDDLVKYNRKKKK